MGLYSPRIIPEYRPPAGFEPDTIIGVESPEQRTAYMQWLMAGRRIHNPRYLEYSSFSGADIKASIWIPPDSSAPPGTRERSGSLRTWAELQTLTISSERPPGPVRSLGSAAVRDYVRGVRTIAGSLIFTVLDRDVFMPIYQKSRHEDLSEFPSFVDAIPPFHIVIKATNEMGFTAASSLIDVTLTNFGTTYSIDDLMIESTYTYVARYVHPFGNPDSWRNQLSKTLISLEEFSNALSKQAQRMLKVAEKEAAARLNAAHKGITGMF